MFFKTPSIHAKIQTVVNMEWERVNARAGARHFHTLSLRLIGGATLFFDNRESIQVEEGEITFIPENFPFGKKANKGHIIAIHFTSATPLPYDILHFKPRNTAYFQNLFLELYQVWTQKALGYGHKSKMLFYKILYAIEKEWAEKAPSLSNELLEAACRHIHTNFTDPTLTVAQLAKMSAMSETYFRRLFIAEFRTTPCKYINQLRLTLAKELLETNYYTVSEISERCGFSNIHYFCSFFKKQTGLSPLEFKNKKSIPVKEIDTKQ